MSDVTTPGEPLAEGGPPGQAAARLEDHGDEANLDALCQARAPVAVYDG
jgi:hypothetical protein